MGTTMGFAEGVVGGTGVGAAMGVDVVGSAVGVTVGDGDGALVGVAVPGTKTL